MATVYDTLEILEDGIVVYTQNVIKEKLSANLTWATATTNGTITRFYSLDFAKGTKGVKTKKLGNTNIVCNMLPTDKNSTEFNVSVSGYDTDGRIYVKLENSVADTVDKLKEYLTNNDVYVIYQLETPIVTHIPKELVPAILTHNQTNILEAGGAVKPSSFKVTVPTTDGIKKEYTLTPINGWKGTAKANLLQTGDIELVLDLTIPSSFNASICSLATELRPKAERTVLGYNGNTPVVVKIGTDGTVKLPVTATGVVKLDDTYKL